MQLRDLKCRQVMTLSVGKQGTRSAGSATKAFRTTKKPTSAIFLGLAKETEKNSDIYRYLIDHTPLRNPCKVAIGSAVAYVDQSHFFFYNRRINEKVDRSYAK